MNGGNLSKVAEVVAPRQQPPRGSDEATRDRDLCPNREPYSNVTQAGRTNLFCLLLLSILRIVSRFAPRHSPGLPYCALL